MIGERIKETREKNGLTQAVVAKKLNISRSAVNAWEMGVSIPSAQYLIAIGQLFHISTDYLLGLETREMVDISFLDEEEKKMIYSFLGYVQKYGRTMRRLAEQIEKNYDNIKRTTEGTEEKEIKSFLEEILWIKENF